MIPRFYSNKWDHFGTNKFKKDSFLKKFFYLDKRKFFDFRNRPVLGYPNIWTLLHFLNTFFFKFQFLKVFKSCSNSYFLFFFDNMIADIFIMFFSLIFWFTCDIKIWTFEIVKMDRQKTRNGEKVLMYEMWMRFRRNGLNFWLAASRNCCGRCRCKSSLLGIRGSYLSLRANNAFEYRNSASVGTGDTISNAVVPRYTSTLFNWCVTKGHAPLTHNPNRLISFAYILLSIWITFFIQLHQTFYSEKINHYLHLNMNNQNNFSNII